MSLFFPSRKPAVPTEAERSQISFAEYTKLIEPWLPYFTQKPVNRERAERTLSGMTRHAHATNGVAFACAAVRMQVFSEVTFKFQNLASKKLYGSPALSLLERGQPEEWNMRRKKTHRMRVKGGDNR